MGVPLLDPEDPLSATFRSVVDERLARFLDTQQGVLAELGPDLACVQVIARRLLAGGKRLRPAFCVWGFVAAAGLDAVGFDPVGGGLLDAAASLELLHASALVHDDVMDGSDLRRGQPAVHRQFAGLHAEQGWLGSADGFGRAGAILLGDLLLMWSVELLERAGSGTDRWIAAAPIAQLMRTEVTSGQYLDVVAQARPPTPGDGLAGALADANRVVEFKSARYSVQRPCQLGAALGGAGADGQQALARYGSPLGRAFQFRDDLLGVFGDPAVTGKPAGDDLREGKRTVLIAHALAHAGPAGRRLIQDRLGDPSLDDDGVRAVQAVIIESGAREAVETMIGAAYEQAMVALDEAPITAEGRTALGALASAAVHRTW